MIFSTLNKFIILLLCCLLSTYNYAQMLDHVPGEVLIKLKSGKSVAEKTAIKNRIGANSLKSYPQSGIELWQVNTTTNIKQLVNQHRYDADIEFIEPNYLYFLDEGIGADTPHGYAGADLSPGDPSYTKLWGLHNTGQNGGTSDADIDAPEGWDIATGSPNVKVAVIDSGIDWRHEDLAENIWQNLAEDADGDGRVLEWNGTQWIFDPGDENGIDDDNNGYTDDFIGWDFVNNDNNPYDDRGHGTHVAGTIGARGNNGKGIAGVTWEVQMAALKIFAGTGSAKSNDIIQCIEYAIDMDFRISNCSWGGSAYSDGFFAALQSGEASDNLFVFSAGNYGYDNDIYPYYPANYPLNNIISVANTDRNDALYVGTGTYDASNYGATTVDIAAPGTDILSTLPNNTYGNYTGTSMAAPHVAGVCALLWGQHPTKTYTQIKSAILNSADPTTAMNGNCVSDGRLNLYGAINEFGTPPPSGCRYNDSLSLVALYNATDGANWDADAVWDLTQPINMWNGVTLDQNGCVYELNLYSDGLDGNIPPEIGNLTNLRELDLGWNGLSGNIPLEIGNLTNLTFLHLLANDLSGNIPPEIENLTNLRYLILSENGLSGNIPLEIGNLTNLINLNLESNQLSGCYDENLLNLYLYAGNNATVSNGNNFDVPWETFFYSLNGTGACTPPSYPNCQENDSIALVALFNSTNGLSWDINQPVQAWEGVYVSGFGCVIGLSLNNYQIDGNIPPEIGNLTKLTYLDLSSNDLSGSIPPEIGNLTNLTYWDLCSNDLDGSIPPEIGNLNKLRKLGLHYNDLSGCYNESLLNLCNQLSPTYNTNNYYISRGNNFDAPWEDFCNSGIGACSTTPPAPLVYPGDFNNDGTANETDYLHWGLALAQGSNGPARPNASTAWVGQDCPDWTYIIQGINGKHQDGNGNGTVTDIDQQALLNNFGQTHNFTQPAYLASSTIYRLEELPPVAGNLRYELYVEDVPGVPAVAHGIAFTFETNNISITNVTMNATNSSLQPYDELTVYDQNQNKLHIALTRNDGNNRTLSGAVAEFIVATNDLPDGEEFDFNIGSGTQVQADGTLNSVAGTTASGIYSSTVPSSGNMTVTTVATHAQCNTTGQVEVQLIGGIAPYTYTWNTGANTQVITELTPSIYEVTVTDANGTIEVRSAEVYGQYIPIFDANGNQIPCNPTLCSTLLTPGGNVPSGTYQANTAVNSDGTIPTNGSVQYKSGNVIILNGDFEVQPGASFEAIIENCNGN